MDILDTLLRADLDGEQSEDPRLYSFSLGNKILTLGDEPACPTHSPDDDISRFITSVSPQAICINGRFGDVFKGTHKTMGDVALKRLRIAASALAEEVVRVSFRPSIVRLGNLYYYRGLKERQIRGVV